MRSAAAGGGACQADTLAALSTLNRCGDGAVNMHGRPDHCPPDWPLSVALVGG